MVSALHDPSNPKHPEPLIDLEDLAWGGVQPDQITPIDRPMFERMATVDWLETSELVVVLSFGDEARAYPVQILIWHEIVNDTFGDTPVSVTYCPLCNSAVGFRREIGSRVLSFGTSGLLLNSALVMYDRQTESLWSHFTGEAIAGELTGTKLELLPMTTMAAGTFAASYPDGLVLSRETGMRRNYGLNPYPGYDDPDARPFLFSGPFDDRLPPQTKVLAVRRGASNVVVTHDELAELGVVDLEVSGESLVAFHLPGAVSALDAATVAGGRDVGATAVFVAESRGRSLSFSRQASSRAGDSGDFVFVDDQTGSTWTLNGQAVAGPLEGETLELVEHLDTFWFAIAAYDPDVVIASI